MKCLYIPREINKSYVLIWERDELVFLLLPFMIFFITFTVMGFILSLLGVIIIAMALKNLRVNKPNGYILHWVMYNIPRQKSYSVFSRANAFPPSNIRHIAG